MGVRYDWYHLKYSEFWDWNDVAALPRNGLYILERVPEDSSLVKVTPCAGVSYTNYNLQDRASWVPIYHSRSSYAEQKFTRQELESMLKYTNDLSYAMTRHSSNPKNSYVSSSSLQINVGDQLQIDSKKEFLLPYIEFIQELLKDNPSKQVFTQQDFIKRPVDPNYSKKRASLTVIPIIPSILRSLSPKYQQELMQESFNLLMNYYKWYKLPKKKWYQKGIFKVFTFVVSIALSWVTSGASLAYVIAVNVMVNAAVFMVTLVLSEMFGKIGAILGVVISAVAIALGQSGGTAGLSAAMNVLTSPTFWLSLANAIVQSISQALQEVMVGILKQIQDLNEFLDKKLKEVDEAYKALANKGPDMSSIWMSPSKFLAYDDTYYAESVDDFMSRTLATGSDIIENQLGQIHNYVDANLDVANIKG